MEKCEWCYFIPKDYDIVKNEKTGLYLCDDCFETTFCGDCQKFFKDCVKGRNTVNRYSDYTCLPCAKNRGMLKQ